MDVIYTKESLIEKLKEIRAAGWIRSTRQGNKGGVGNTIEDLLGIKENNLPIPNAAEWELKCQRVSLTGAMALTTLFHCEPSPRALKFVPKIFLPKYGWPLKGHPGELSFRQTITGGTYSPTGFTVVVDRLAKKVVISFAANRVAPTHSVWLESVSKRANLKELDPQPYWGFDDLFAIARVKLLNCFHLQAETKKEGEVEFFRYSKISILQDFSFDGFLTTLEQGGLFVDFDARTGVGRAPHNHGTKFRLRAALRPELYKSIIEIQ